MSYCAPQVATLAANPAQYYETAETDAAPAESTETIESIDTTA